MESRTASADVKRHIRRTRAAAIALAAIIALVLGAATYAWFASNMAVNTNSVSVHSDDSRLLVEMGDADANSWSSADEVALSTNSPDSLVLYPVSTFDLSGFAQCTHTDGDGNAAYFKQAEDGQTFYHGWTDLRASVVGAGADKATGRVSLYLADSLVPDGADPELLRATRVGLKLARDGEVVKTCYFSLDDTAGSHRDEHPATRPSSLPSYSDGMLLGWRNGELACANDGVEDYRSYLMGSDESATRPQSALATLDQGAAYRLDVYYYIEGTDADSADYLYGDIGILHLGLFAVLDGQGA